MGVYQSQFLGEIADIVTGRLNQTVFTGGEAEKQSQVKVRQLPNNVLETPFIHSSASWAIKSQCVRQD